MVRDDHQALALREARRRRPLGEPGDALDDVALDAPVLEPADGAALHDDLGEVHGVSFRRDLPTVRPRMATSGQPGRGRRGRAVIVEVDGSTLLYVVLPGDHPARDSIFESIRFLDGLPTGP